MSDPIEITTHRIAGRQFINFGDCAVVPVDRIKRFDFTVANGGAGGRSVQIVTDDPFEYITFAFENRDAVARFIEANRVVGGDSHG